MEIGKTIKELNIGDKASFTKTIAENDVYQFAGISGDFNPVHVNEEYANSKRAKGPFVRVNCANLPTSLIESELFGYEKGAFTGATKTKPGKVEIADGGTLFLDEISTLGLESQAALLQLIQEQEFERVGGMKTIKVDVRIISASNQNLRQLVKNKLFREDLFSRLNVFNIIIPALRDRKEDILPLANGIIMRLSGSQDIMIASEAASCMEQYHWPGNIRELENVMKHALILLGDENLIKCSHFPWELNQGYCLTKEDNPGLKELLDRTERQLIQQALQENEMDLDRTAAKLKLAKRSLYYRMGKLNIKWRAT